MNRNLSNGYSRQWFKMATLSASLAQALRERGIGEPDASLVAEAGIAVFRVAFMQWVGESEQRDFVGIVMESFERLKLLTGN